MAPSPSPVIVAPPGARAAALLILRAVIDRRQPLDEAFDEVTRSIDDIRERGFARALATAVLRGHGFLEAALARCLDRPLDALDRRLRPSLLLGAAQVLILDVPDHAAVAATVDLVTGPLTRLRGLANAVLRRLVRDRAALLADLDRPRLQTPDWLWDSWSAAFGPAVARMIAEAHCREPTLDLTVKGDGKGEGADWAARLGAELLPTGSLRLPAGGRIEQLAGFDEGAWWVQDAAAAIPARLFGDVAGARVLDLCAAPGGKTAQLAASGAQVTAIDRSRARTERLRRNLARLHLEAEVITGDVAGLTPAPAPFVLLDAPCSATGTLRRNPDIALHRGLSDIAACADLQARLLDHAARLVAPGGRLVYCTCSLQPEEGAVVVDRVLAGGAPLRRLAIEPGEVPGLTEAITPVGDLRLHPGLWPERGGLDGFFVSRLVRS